jgi:ubiquinone/menaquinone biosynthesis C-methylase UbiE
MSTDYLRQTYNYSDPELVLSIDELALWSAPFGLKLLDMVEMKTHINVLDIGPGPGFPMIEIAQRLGTTSKIYGIDPWDAAIERVKQKITFFQLTNIHIQHAVAESIPFQDKFFDLIVSNNGLNNVEDIDQSLSECFRVTKPGAQMVITMNLPDSFIEFYTIFQQTLTELKLEKYLKNIEDHIYHKRKPLDFWQKALKAYGFSIKAEHVDIFKYKFANGTALLNYSTFKMYFLDSWKSCVDATHLVAVFEKLEASLNSYAAKNRGIELTVPFVCFDLRRA